MSEPRRWWFHAESLSVMRDDVANIEYVTDPKNGWVSLVPEGLTLARIEDHDRIMAERDELWKRATKFVMPGEMDTGESIEHYIETLEQANAQQAKVIEKLKLQRGKILHEKYAGFPLLAMNAESDLDKELEAIEREGAGT